MPAESRPGFNTGAPNDFVDHRQADDIIAKWSAQQWQDQAFFGEDYAGREDIAPLFHGHSPQPRQTIGAFFCPLITTGTIAQPIELPSHLPGKNHHHHRNAGSFFNYRNAAIAAITLSLAALAPFAAHRKTNQPPTTAASSLHLASPQMTEKLQLPNSESTMLTADADLTSK